MCLCERISDLPIKTAIIHCFALLNKSETEPGPEHVQNQHARELISAQNMLHKYSNKDLSCLW